MKFLATNSIVFTAIAVTMSMLPSNIGAYSPVTQPALDCPRNVSSTTTDPREKMCYYIQYNRENYDILFSLPSGFHNHLSFYIVALWRLGANSSRMDQAFEDLSPDLCPTAFPSQGLITDDNWREYIGMNATQISSIHYKDYQEYYERKISEIGADAVFQEVFPEVVDGLSGDLFHGLIALGYAVESNDTQVLADGLAWMSTGYAPLPDMNSNPIKSSSNPIELLIAIEQDQDLPQFPGDEVGNIQRTMSDLSANYSMHLSQYDLYLGDSSADYSYMQQAMRDVSDAILLAFASDGYTDFFLVHMLTSARAVEVLLQTVSNGWGMGPSTSGALIEGNRLDTQRRAIAAIWKAAVYVYVARGRPQISESSLKREGMVYPDPDPTWSDIVERTISIRDAHLQKLILLLHRNYYNRGRQDPLFIHAALQAVEYFEAGADNNRGRWYGEGDGKPKQCDVSKFLNPIVTATAASLDTTTDETQQSVYGRGGEEL